MTTENQAGQRNAFARAFAGIGEKKRGYWVRAAITLFVGVSIGGWLAERDCWREARLAAYRSLYKFNPRKPIAKWITLILIEDDEYWFGDLAGRKPTNRDYLARLLRAAAEVDPKPAAIALDFDLASPSPDGTLIDHPKYQIETRTLLDTIRDVGLGCPIVISKALGPDQDRGYTVDSNIYDQYDFGRTKVWKGYISLPDDERLVAAASMPLADGRRLDSFAGAIVKTLHPEMLLDEESNVDRLPYGDFMDLVAFKKVSARDVLNKDASALAALAHRLVIIGAHWHTGAVGRGPFVDLHPSPNGDMPGVALHANYVEAILDSRLHGGWNPIASRVIELVGALLVIMIFALDVNPFTKALAVGATALMLFVVSVVSLLLLGLIFEFFVPVVTAIGHGILERIKEWRDKALS
jgi:CHASE2 domain-containing sensor protein